MPSTFSPLVDHLWFFPTVCSKSHLMALFSASYTLMPSIHDLTHFRAAARSLMEACSDVDLDCPNSCSYHPGFGAYSFQQQHLMLIVSPLVSERHRDMVLCRRSYIGIIMRSDWLLSSPRRHISVCYSITSNESDHTLTAGYPSISVYN